MSKRFTFMKSALLFIAVLMTAFTLVACGEDQQAIVDEALTSVDLVFASGDSATSVTQNLTLPTTVGDVEITWASGNTGVISNAGVVTRQTADTNVTLTATLTLGDATATKAFTLKVLAIVVVIDPLDALDAIVLAGDSLEHNATTDMYTTLDSVTLPAIALTLSITWSSSNPAVISAAGVVSRPAYGYSDSTVILTATIGDETKDFAVVVSAITVKPAALILSDAKDALLLVGVGDGVAADIDLPATAGSEGVTVTWTSGNTDYITDAGVVTRPYDANKTVTLTATLHIGDETVTKDFDVVVLTFEPFTAVTDIAAAMAAQVTADDDVYVEIPDVTVIATWTTGYMIYDGTTLMQVYQVPTDEVVEGAVFTIRGIMTNYYGALEITGDTNMPIVLFDSTATALVLEPTVITSSVSEYIATLPTYPLASPAVYQYIQITAKVQVDDPVLKYETFLVDTDYSGADINVVDPANFTLNAFMIYYPTNLGAVRLYDGLEVTLNIFVFGQRTDKLIWYVLYTGETEDIQTTLDDAGIVGVVKSSLEIDYELAYAEATTIDLPTTMMGTTIVWDTASEYVDVLTGEVTMPATPGQVEVTLTAEITRGLTTETATVTFKVGELAVSTMAEVQAMVKGELIRVQGIYAAKTKSTAFWIQDSTGGLNIYASGAFLTQIQGLALGVEIEMFGTLEIYNGLFEIINLTEINVVNATPAIPAPASLNAVEFSNTGLLPYQGTLVSFDGFLLKYDVNATTYSFNFTLYNPISGYQIAARAESTIADFAAVVTYLNALDVNAPINIVGGVIGWYNNFQLAITGSSNFVAGTVTDAHKIALDALEIDVPTAVIEATTLTTLLATGTNGSAITWASDNVLIDVTTGVVTLPVSGQVTVTLTASLSLGTETKEVTFEVEVGQTDLQKIDADALELDVADAVTEATTITTLITTGTNGSAITWASDNVLIDATTGVVTLPVSGQVTVTLTATLSLGTETKEVTFEVVVGMADTSSTTVTASYTDTVTTNMVALVNNATSVNLDPLLFDVTATNGSAYSLVGLNSAGQIRIYGNRADGLGNTLFVEIAAGYTISSVVFTYGDSSNVPLGILTLGSVTSNLVAADLTNTTGTYTGLDIQSFSLQNTCLGGTSNAQIYVLSIEITYQAVVSSTTVIASYTDTVTTNMVALVNNATSVNLDPLLFDVTATNGSAYSLVGLNSAGQIRIYGNRADGLGNTLFVEIAAGYTISSVVFTYGDSSNVPLGILTLGSVTSNLVQADLTNTTGTYTGLDIQSFSLQNTCLGGTSNAQIYVLSIEITYEAV